MARFDDAWMDTLLSKNDIVSVVSSYVSLKSKGNRLWGLCPFHNEKTPSFSVNADKQLFYCFGCGAGGGVVQFVMQIERLPFGETVELLARRAGMEMPNSIGDEQLRRNRARKERLLEACKLSALYFHKTLLSDEGEAARRYLSSRALDASAVKRFGLGFAPDTWTSLTDHLTEAGFTKEELLDAGLVKAKSDRVYDAYRNRVIFPIIGTDSRVMGFGARTMGDDLPKYINTSETPIYNKGRSLYALNSAKKERSDSLIIVEGYMDVISLYAAGIKNAVASLGTALTAQQARLVKRYASNVYIAYDGDSAGQNATLRGLDILQAEGLKVRVIVLPEGLDPDDFVRRNGREAFDELKEKALALNEFKLMRMAERYDLGTDDGRQDYALEACRFIASMQPVEKERYLAFLSRTTGIQIEALRAQSTGAEAKGKAEPNSRTLTNPRRRRSGGTTERLLMEQSLLKALIQAPEHVDALGTHPVEHLLSLEAYRRLAQHICAHKSADAVRIMSELEPDEANAIAPLFGGEEKIAQPRRYIEDCVKRILKADAMAEIQELKARTNDETIPLEQRLEDMSRIAELKKRL